MRVPVGCVLLALAVAACSGGNAAIPNAPPEPTPSKVKVKVAFTIVVPSLRQRGRGRHAQRVNPRLKRVWTVAENTAGIQVVAYATGTRTNPLGTTVANISAGAASCGATDPYGGRSCTLNLQAPPGTDDFVATTYDKPPAGGSIPASANQLGYGVATKTIVAGSAANVTLALSGVLSKITLAATPSTLHTIIPSTATLNVYGLDADGDVIVTNGYIDGNGNTITVGLSVDNTLPLSTASSAAPPSLTLSPASITAPQPAGVSIAYAPQGNGIVNPSTQTVTVSASPSASSVTTTAATIKAIAPSFSSMSVTNLDANNPYHGGIAFDSNAYADNVYFTAPNGFGSIIECTACAFAATPGGGVSLGTSTNPIRGGIAGDGQAQYFPGGSNFIYTVAGTVAETIGNGPTQVPIPGASAAPIPNGSAMAYDTSLNGGLGGFWYTSGAELVPYFISGTTPPNPVLLAVTTTGGVALDSSFNPWVVDTVNNRIIECTACTTAPLQTSGALQSGGAPLDVATVGTRVFVTDHQAANPAIIEVAPGGGSVNIVRTLSLPANAAPWYLTTDRAQSGIVWFDYLSGGNIGFGRMDTNVTPPTFLMATAPVASETFCSLSSASGQAGAIGIGPSGTVYMVFDTVGCLMRVQR